MITKPARKRARKAMRRTSPDSVDAAVFLEELVGPLTVGGMLKSHRECWEIPQAELARRLGISRANLNDIEKGRKLVSPERAARFATTLEKLPQHWVCIALEDILRANGMDYKVRLEDPPRHK